MDKYLSLAIDKMVHTEHMHKALIDSKVREIGIHRTQHRILMRLARCGRLPSQKLQQAGRLPLPGVRPVGQPNYIIRPGRRIHQHGLH